jgi:hypothetical protein
MKLAVGADEVAVLPFRRQRCLQRDLRFQLRDKLGRGLFGQLMHDLEFYRAAQKVRLPGRVDVDAAHQRCVLRKHIHQPFLGQPQQGLAHGCLAHAEPVGQLLPNQHRAGHEFKRKNGITQLLEHLWCCETRAVESDPGEGGHSLEFSLC